MTSKNYKKENIYKVGQTKGKCKKRVSNLNTDNLPIEILNIIIKNVKMNYEN
jgi:hypothetical protein